MEIMKALTDSLHTMKLFHEIMAKAIRTLFYY